MMPNLHAIIGILNLISIAFAITLNKCCPYGKLLDLHTKACVDDSLATEREESIAVVSFDFTTGDTKQTKVNLTNPSQPYSKCILSQRRNIKQYAFAFGGGPMGDKHIVIATKGFEQFDRFCVDRNNVDKDDTARIQICDDCASQLCLSYCCQLGAYTSGGQCKEDNNTARWNWDIQHARVHSDLYCETPTKYPKHLYEVKNNELVVDKIPRDHSEYCITNVLENGVPVSNVLLCPKTNNQNKTGRKVAKIILLTFSEASILIVLIFHCLVSELRRTHFAKMKMAFLSCLLITFFILIISLIINFKRISDGVCIFIGLLLQYFGLATFFWLTCLSFDIWLTFRKLNDPTDNTQGKERLRSILTKTFFLVSFLGPLFIMLVTAILQTLSTKTEVSYLPPGIGEPSCFLKQYEPLFFYFNLVVIILLSINLVFYALLVYAFFWGVWANNRNFHIKRNNMKICLELIMIMGLNWVSEFVNFMISWQDSRNWDHPISWVFDILNWLTGVFILLAFVTKSSNQKHLKAYFSCFTRRVTGTSLHLDSYRARTSIESKSSPTSGNSQDTTRSHCSITPQNSVPSIIDAPLSRQDSPSGSFKSNNSEKNMSTLTSLESSSSGVGSLESDTGVFL